VTNQTNQYNFILTRPLMSATAELHLRAATIEHMRRQGTAYWYRMATIAKKKRETRLLGQELEGERFVRLECPAPLRPPVGFVALVVRG
jgi:hypothetical protein